MGRVTTLLVASRALRFAIGLVNSIILARVLGVERLGAYAYAMGIAALFGLLPSMGIATLVTRTVARESTGGSGILKTALNAQALVSGVTLLLIPGVASLLPGQPVPLLFIWLAAAQLTVGTLSWPYLGLLSGKMRYDRVAVAELLSAVTGTVCLVVAAVSLGTPAGFLCAQVVAATLAAVFARGLASPLIDTRDESRVSLGSLFRSGLPFGAAAATEGLYRRIDVLLLGQLSSTVAVGLYNVAYKPTNLLVYFGTTMAAPLFPIMARASGKAVPLEFRRVLRGLALLAPTVALLFSGMAGPILRLMYGPGFVEASAIMVVLVWSAAANWLYAPLSAALQAQGKERWWLAVLVGGLALNASGNLWAIPRWGALGAAGATLGSELVMVLAAAALVCRHFQSLPPLKSLLAGTLATLVSCGLLYLLHGESGSLVSTFVAIAVYAVLVVVSRVVRREDALAVVDWIQDALPRLRLRKAGPPDEAGQVVDALKQSNG